MHYAAFLRGINLGGRRAKGEQLCAPFEQLGFHDVVSFLASGNIVFGTDDPTDLEERIEAGLEAELGYPVDTFVRTAAEVADVSRLQPFPAEVVAASGGKLQVTFLRRAPAQGAVEDALAHANDEDRLAVTGREWYWLPSGGMTHSSLDVRALEGILGRGTTRTVNTVARLHAKLLSDRAT
jgi:uncharacterized protein (DUF1697 family)